MVNWLTERPEWNRGGGLDVPKVTVKPVAFDDVHCSVTGMATSVAPFAGDATATDTLPGWQPCPTVNERTGVVLVICASHAACATTNQNCVPRGVTCSEFAVRPEAKRAGGFAGPRETSYAAAPASDCQ